MIRAKSLTKIPALILMAGTAQCGSTSDAPPGQVLLFIDTDAPPASLAGSHGFLTEGSVDTLKIDVLSPDNSIISSVEVTAPDEANWPVSFGVQGMPGAVVSRLRLRAFRAQNARAVTDPETQAKVFETIGDFTIDRVVEIPVPYEKGVFAFRVVLHSACRGHRPDFTSRTNCVAPLPAEEEDGPFIGVRRAGFREGIESIPHDLPPERTPLWWPGKTIGSEDGDDCLGVECPHDSICIPGGFFMLGDLRVVGFGASRNAVPPRPVAMQPFCIDKTEFTVERYEALSLPWPNANDPGYNGKTDPNQIQLCSWFDPSMGSPNPQNGLPMNCISRTDAVKACKAMDGRLPTEAEWEYVATGMGKGSLFPWGDAPPYCNPLDKKDKMAILEQQDTDFLFYPTCGLFGVEPVQDNPYGDRVAVRENQEVWHLSGSMSEWTLDSYAPYGGSDDQSNCWQHQGVLLHPSCELPWSSTAQNPVSFSVRGGNFVDPMSFAYAALRRNEDNTTLSEFIGFRCVYPPIGQSDPVRYIKPESEGTSPGGPENPGEENREP